MSKRLTGRVFDAMSAADKQKIIGEIEAETPGQRRARGRPPTPAEQARFDRLAKRMRGRPKLGNGTEAITVTIEKDLLNKVKAYAQRLGLKRSQLFAIALKAILPQPKALAAADHLDISAERKPRAARLRKAS